MFSLNRINFDDPADALLWADNLSISVERLHAVIAKVGPMAPAVRFYVKKTALEHKPAVAKNAIPQKASAGAATPATAEPSMIT